MRFDWWLAPNPPNFSRISSEIEIRVQTHHVSPPPFSFGISLKYPKSSSSEKGQIIGFAINAAV
jgi:hypothetical protein